MLLVWQNATSNGFPYELLSVAETSHDFSSAPALSKRRKSAPPFTSQRGNRNAKVSRPGTRKNRTHTLVPKLTYLGAWLAGRGPARKEKRKPLGTGGQGLTLENQRKRRPRNDTAFGADSKQSPLKLCNLRGVNRGKHGCPDFRVVPLVWCLALAVTLGKHFPNVVVSNPGTAVC